MNLGRRQHILLSVNLGFLGSQLSGTDDPTTVLNSILGGHRALLLPETFLENFFAESDICAKACTLSLCGWGATGAYGLPQLKGAGGFKLYDDFDQEYVFEYPRSWVGRSNSLRQGVYVSDFNVHTPTFRKHMLCSSSDLSIFFVFCPVQDGSSP